MTEIKEFDIVVLVFFWCLLFSSVDWVGQVDLLIEDGWCRVGIRFLSLWCSCRPEALARIRGGVADADIAGPPDNVRECILRAALSIFVLRDRM
jgi:hypothetical protein